MNFLGYRRSDGRVGTRNYVGIISTVVCANEVAKGIADQVSGAVAFTHQQGCCQTSPDLIRVTDTLCGLGCNPNLAAVLLIGLGCEGTEMPAVQKAVATCGKPVQTLFIQEMGGAAKTTAKGVLIAQEMAIQASRIKPQECDAGDIVLGLKCGSSDTTSGLAATACCTAGISVPSQPRPINNTPARLGLQPSPHKVSVTRLRSGDVWQHPCWWVNATAPLTWSAIPFATSLAQTTVEMIPT